MYSAQKKEALRYLGYRGQELPHDIDSLLNEAVEIVSRYRPLHDYSVSEVVFSQNSINLPDIGLSPDGTSIYKYLHGAVKCITFACTIGAEFEKELMRMQTASITKALIFDAVGTAFVEKAADEATEELLIPFFNAGLYAKPRYSPGYGDLPLELQQQIIERLDCPKRIGLTVTENNILIPRKSITAFIGLFKTPQEKPSVKCELCQMRDSCKIRKDGYFCD